MEENNKSNPNVEVHTMPDKFISSSPSYPTGGGDQPMGKPKKSKASWIIIAVIIIAVLAILGGAGFLIYTNLPSDETQQVVDQGQVNANANVNAVANANANTNKNANANSNANKNSNENENENSNNNENENANTNDNENTNSNSNSNTNANTNTSAEVEMAEDEDIDGLTLEEEKLYGTEIDKPDTDKDGFKDGSEIINGYNPAGEGTLAESDLVETYDNQDYDYTIAYPAQWMADTIAEEPENVIFNSNDLSSAGEFIEVIVETNPYGFKALDWYLEQNQDVAATQLEEVEVNNLEGVLSVDGYTVYFADDDYIYAITYSYGSKKEVNFISTFEMMYKSFKLSKKTKRTEVNENANANTNANSNDNININAESDIN